MKVTLFRKQGTTKDGRKFNIFVTTLNRKDGTKQYATVKYSGGDETKQFNPNKCPYIINVDKKHANIGITHWTDRNGEVREDYTLWVKDYTVSDEEYVDHSLDDFD